MEILNSIRKHYEAARSELVMRLRLRDQVILVYLAFVGAIYGIVLNSPAKVSVLLVVPFIGLGCSIIVSQHNAVVGTLISYINNDVLSILRNKDAYACEFVNSESFRNHSKRSNLLRSVGHAIIILTPSLMALASNWQHAMYSPFPMGPLWWFALVCVCFSAYIIYRIHKFRQDVYINTPWDTGNHN